LGGIDERDDEHDNYASPGARGHDDDDHDGAVTPSLDGFFAGNGVKGLCAGRVVLRERGLFRGR
jgi:hypothetical protein